MVFAELTDHHIFSRATGINQRTWGLGDTFEMFLRSDGQSQYSEFHGLNIPPNRSHYIGFRCVQNFLGRQKDDNPARASKIYN